MYTIEELSNSIENHCKGLPLDFQPQGLYAPICYIMEDGGKRMRPLLTLLSANIYGEHIEKAINAAIAIEVFHNFTLLHDDIMDKASLRRGRQTVHVKWNENSAILSGDAMLILAYQTLCGGCNTESLYAQLEEFNKVSMEVCQGQQYDMEFESRSAVRMDEYLEMIRLKTAVLMASALKMGAIAQGASVQQQQAVYDFGINLGLAFQIQDDLLDTYGDKSTFGKAIGGDIAVGKQTFLRIAAIERADDKTKQTLCDSRDYNQVRAIYDSMDISSVAIQAIESYFAKAMLSLESCTQDGSRLEVIRQYADVLLKRER